MKAKRYRRSKPGILTERDLRIIALICRDTQHKVIGTALGFSESAIRHAVARLIKISGSRSVVGVAVWAIERGHYLLPCQRSIEITAHELHA